MLSITPEEVREIHKRVLGKCSDEDLLAEVWRRRLGDRLTQEQMLDQIEEAQAKYRAARIAYSRILAP